VNLKTGAAIFESLPAHHQPFAQTYRQKGYWSDKPVPDFVADAVRARADTVALVDRKLPGNETSFGNAGLIQREAVYPYAFPRDPGTLLRYARNRSTDVRYHPDAIPTVAAFLLKYWRNSQTGREHAFELSSDPDENHDSIGDVPAHLKAEWRSHSGGETVAAR